MSTKVSQLTELESFSDGDMLLITHNGVSMKINASKFLSALSAAPNSEKLGGVAASEYQKKSDAARNADKLGNVAASDYATKEYVNSRTGQGVSDPTWCCPKLWFSTTTLPNNDTVNYAFCDGRYLDPEAYPELFAVIGYTFGRNPLGDEFKLPDMQGRFPLGAYMGAGDLTTENLPRGLYSGEDFTEQGQWKYPKVVGKAGGDPTTVQDSPYQMASHNHTFTGLQRGQEVKPAESGGAYRVTGANPTITTSNAGACETTYAQYPPNPTGGNFNYGMLSMPPYLTFAWIIRIKP